MLKKLKIERFKSARHIDLEFGRVNLFIGGNGSGKSNILEAIGVISASLYRGISDSELARKGVRLTPPALMKSAFKNFVLPKTLRIEAEIQGNIQYAVELASGEKNTHLNFFSEKCTHAGVKVFGRSARGVSILDHKVQQRRWDPARSLWDQARVAYDFPEIVVSEFDQLSRYAIYSPQTEFLREIKAGVADDPPVGLHGEGLNSAVSSLLEQFRDKNNTKPRDKHKPTDRSEYDVLREALSLVWLPGWTNAVRVGEVDSTLKSRQVSTQDGRVVYFLDRYMHERRNTLSAYDSSEGTLFLLFMSVLLGHQDAPKIFSLDNVDSALNPALTKKLLEKIIQIVKMKSKSGLKTGAAQVFLTSHNPTALDAFDLFDDDQRVFVLFRNKDGHTIARRLKPKDGWSREEWSAAFKGKKLSQLWIDGEISGALGSL